MAINSVAASKGRTSLADKTTTLKPGDAAPDFELKSHTGESVRLSQFKGQKNVVLAFYPFAFTGTCGTQIPTYEANLGRFEAAGAQVLGISIDSTHANGEWAKSLGGITYPLLSDFFPHGAVAQAYGVLRPEGMAERAIFIIDKAGVVRYIDVHTIKEVPDEEQLFEELSRLG